MRKEGPERPGNGGVHVMLEFQGVCLQGEGAAKCHTSSRPSIM